MWFRTIFFVIVNRPIYICGFANLLIFYHQFPLSIVKTTLFQFSNSLKIVNPTKSHYTEYKSVNYA